MIVIFRSAFERLSPQMDRFMSCPSSMPVKAVIITEQGPGEYDYLCRFFSPWFGVDEDPVTGRWHLILKFYSSVVVLRVYSYP